MEDVRRALQRDAYASHLGIDLLSLKEGCARARMTLKSFHGNMYGMIHGGAIFSLADFVFQAASNSHGEVAVAIHANVSYIQAPRTTVLYAEATEVSRTRRLANYAVRVTEDGDGLIAMFQGTVYRMPDKPVSAE